MGVEDLLRGGREGVEERGRGVKVDCCVIGQMEVQGRAKGRERGKRKEERKEVSGGRMSMSN